MIQLTTSQKNLGRGTSGVCTHEHQQEMGVNPAFLQEIRDDQRRLRQLLQAAETILHHRTEAAMDPDTMAELFASLRDQLAQHFSLEESMGYLGEFTVAAPRLCRKADHLRSQHASLYEEICSIADDAEAFCRSNGELSEDRRSKVRQRYADFQDHLQTHNREEDQLIIEVLYFDIGGGD